MTNTKPVVKLETITPERAGELLQGNSHNRTIRQRQVDSLAVAIKRGDWVVNGDMIRLSPTGVLLDGQHRLWAILEADMAVETFVGYGFTDEAQETMDVGRSRTLGDALKLRGEPNFTTTAAAIRKVWAYETYGVPVVLNGHRNPTMQESLACLDRHPDLRAVIEGMSRNRYSRDPNPIAKAGKFIDQSAIAALWYLMSLADSEDAYDFWRRLGGGYDLSETDSIYVLRERLIKEADEAGGGIHPKVKIAFVVRTWNAYRSGEIIKRLVFSPGGANPDRFPRIDGCPIAPEKEVIGSMVIDAKT